MKKRIIALVLVLACLTPIVAYAAQSTNVSPRRASKVFNEYGIGISAKAEGKIVVTADVTAVRIADKLGFPTVQIKEKQADGTWKMVKSKITQYVYNDIAHLVTVSYMGTPGKIYKGFASFYGKIGSNTDNASLETTTREAKE